MTNRKFYLLDRNVISLIRDRNNGKKQTDSNKISMLNRLNKIDRKRSFISPFLSVIEGKTGKSESIDEIKKTILTDSKTLTTFFKVAKVDGDFLIQNQSYISKVFNGFKQNNYLYFLEECSSHLYQKVKNNKETETDILRLANKYEINLSHPTVVCCLSTLYGNKSARKVLKPKLKNYNSYNALSDLMHITEIYHIISMANLNENFKVFNIEFLTLDKGLKSFYSLIKLTNTTWVDNEANFSVNYDSKLFPDLKYEEYLILSKKLGAKII
jgi:hypothetical protein